MTDQTQENLERWKAEALPVISGLQEVGHALGLPLGASITGQTALDAALDLRNRAEKAEAEVERLHQRLADSERTITELSARWKRREAERDAARAELARLDHNLRAYSDGLTCTCTMTALAVYHGDNMHPAEWEQDPWCPTHPDVGYIRQEFIRAEAERDEVAGRLSALLCELTGGRLSKTNYGVRTMVSEIDSYYDDAQQEEHAALEAAEATVARQAAVIERVRALAPVLLSIAADAVRSQEEPDMDVADATLRSIGRRVKAVRDVIASLPAAAPETSEETQP